MLPDGSAGFCFLFLAIARLGSGEYFPLDPSTIEWADESGGAQGDGAQAGGLGGAAVQALLRQIQALSAGPAADPATVQQKAFTELKAAAEMGLVHEDGTEVSRNTGLLPYVYEADVVLTEEQARLILREAQAVAPPDGGWRRRVKRKLAVRTARNRWPTTVAYQLTGGDAAWRRRVEEGLDLWRTSTCLTFAKTEGGGDEERLDFHQGQGCWSFIGRTNTARQGQKVSIAPQCGIATIAHEVGHALGLWHEQARPDRDDFVSIDLAKVPTGNQHNFKVQPRDAVETAIPYDFGSVMHYGASAFVLGVGRSIVPKDKAFAETMGQRLGLSFLDVKTINQAYCGDVCGARGRKDCAHGGYPDPKDCGRCRCPSGLGGATCEAAAASEGAECGGELVAGASWQTVESSAPNARCHWRIRSADGGPVFVRLTAVRYSRRFVSSCATFLEWKWGRDLSRTGARVCGESTPAGRWSEGDVVVLSHDTLSDSDGQGRFSARFIARSNGNAANTTTQATTAATRATIATTRATTWTARPTAATTPSTTTASSSYRVAGGTRWTNRDLRAGKDEAGISWQASCADCVEECQRNSRCTALVWVRDANYCVLKSTADPAAQLTLDDRYDVVVLDARQAYKITQHHTK